MQRSAAKYRVIKGASMGRKTKLESNAALAKPHSVGAKINVIQVLAHSEFGAISYLWPKHWVFEIHLADKAFAKLEALHQELLKLPVNNSNMRMVSNFELLEDIFCAGSDMVSHAARAIQHLCECMEREMGRDLIAMSSTERIKEATAFFGLDDFNEHNGYQGFIEILRIRDAVEHPKMANILRGGNEWDEVPLAWMMSERGLQAYTKFDSWFELIVEEWGVYSESHSRPMELTLKRGIMSKLQSKKSSIRDS